MAGPTSWGTSDGMSNSGVPLSCLARRHYAHLISSCAVPRSSVRDRFCAVGTPPPLSGPSSREKKMASRASLFKVILGSSSASRRRILAEMGYKFTVMGADIDEKEIRREKPEELVMALAEAKADAIVTRLRSNGFKEDHTDPTLLITADQVVVHGGMIREKPSGAEEAREFIKGLFERVFFFFFTKKLILMQPSFALLYGMQFSGYSGGHASTVGSVLVTNLKTGARKGGWDKAEVYFHKIPEEVIESLIKEGDVLYVAGGLMVENPLTSPFVEAIVGTIDSIMGLPKALTEKLIQEALE
ncbi:7-methyl-GTP pyrophosphatase-like isoform X1 [Phoenix dactylifera]|uniref:7-methyl-GTP pyrophosphatase-like isoform X1 n=1 Tax=Phoenix dactylifera TaxID=42345 RepID=A0A8B9AJQ9_PHODC|nr:7-methyl-GTP pyrophosphatase-like isoform X1 [Phoenix dactylifera]